MYQILMANPEGEMWEDDSLAACGWNGYETVKLTPDLVSELTEESYMLLLPQRSPLGIGKRGKKQLPGVWGVCAHPLPGYTRTLLPAYQKQKGWQYMPFFAYSAIGFLEEKIYIAALPTEPTLKWHPSQYNSVDLQNKIKAKIKQFPKNPIVRHLAECSNLYSCFTAQNIFYERWEGGIPVSPACNASCLGCISQTQGGPESPQQRLKFTPTPNEIAEIAVAHLTRPDFIVSFGQGCEGEPLLQAEVIEQAIKLIRDKTDQGIININTNGSRPRDLEKLLKAGMGAVRISLNSAREENYQRYFRPGAFTFKEVKESMAMVSAYGKRLSFNLQLLPGVNDQPEELAAILQLAREVKVKKIQLRNLNIDPEYYFQYMPKPQEKPLGVGEMLKIFRQELPETEIGNFT